MAPEPVERKLAAILSADVVGYSRLMAEDEDATVRTLNAYREEIDRLVRQHRGRVVDTAGDSVLAEFPTATEAVRSAVEIQGNLEARNAALAPERQMEFRIGLHLGEVRAEGDRIYGDGVNIAARLEGLAEAGGVCISATVHEQVRNKLDAGFTDLGDQKVKNIPDPIRVYRVQPRGQSEARARAKAAPAKRPRRLRTALIAAAAVLLLLGAGLWASWPRPLGLLIDVAGMSGPPVDPPLPDKPSIAVLPFANMSGDAQQEYFSDGITEDLTTDLSRNPKLFVIARNSAFSYKGRNVNVEDVGRELGVRYVLEGSVRKAGERVRITAQLIDATSGFHVWSERYDRDLVDIFNLQSEISERILAALQVEISEAEVRRIRSKPTGNLTAYDLVQQALSFHNRYTHKDLLEARRLLEQAVKLDPEYGRAWGLLGGNYTVESSMFWNLDPTLLDRAEELLDRALALDPINPGAHIVLAAVNLGRDRPNVAAVEAQKGIELAPSWPRAHYFLGVAMAQQGRFIEATRAINRAQRLDPKAPPGLLVIIPYVNLAAGRTDAAVEMFEQVRTSNADIILARIPLAAVYEIDGRHAEAQALAREILDVNPEMTAEAAAGKLVASLLGDDRAAEWRVALRSAGLP